jgi:hypothetical protein
MKLIPMTETEIKHVMESLKLKNSARYEGISDGILKICTHAIIYPSVIYAMHPLTKVFTLID